MSESSVKSKFPTQFQLPQSFVSNKVAGHLEETLFRIRWWCGVSNPKLTSHL